MKKKDELPKFSHEVERQEQEDRIKLVKNKYLYLFGSSPIGVEVLANILVNQCYFGRELNPDDKAQIGAYNAGIQLLTMCGAFDNKRMVDVISILLQPIPLAQEE